jgi:hypothetical protein
MGEVGALLMAAACALIQITTKIAITDLWIKNSNSA